MFFLFPIPYCLFPISRMQALSVAFQGGGVKPKAAVSLELSKRELAGRWAL